MLYHLPERVATRIFVDLDTVPFDAKVVNLID